MLSRRHFCGAGVLIGTTATFDGSFAADSCAVQTRERQAALSPDDALAELKAGNERFLSQTMRNCDLLGQVRATAGGQYPFAVVIGCIDSRVPPELVFDQRIGDIFSARIAGNVAEDDVVGSAEFATKLAGAKLIVVLGHSECGAVKGAIDGVELGKLTHLLQRIKPAIAASENVSGEHTSKNKDYVQQVATTNARLAARGLQQDSQVLRDLVAQGGLKIVAAMHDIATGRVTFME
jgi:carbonic anhydrase